MTFKRPPTRDGWHTRRGWRLALGLGVALMVAAGVAWMIYRRELVRVEGVVAKESVGIAEWKLAALERWQSERASDARRRATWMVLGLMPWVLAIGAGLAWIGRRRESGMSAREAAVRAEVSEAPEAPGVMEVVEPVQTDTGTRWVQSRMGPQRQGSGSVPAVPAVPVPVAVAVAGIGEDVMRRKEVERALRASEEKHRLLYEQMLDGFALHEVLCDPEGKPVNYRFLDVNPAFEVVTGMKATAVIGRTVLDLLPGVEPEWIERFGRVALSGEPARFEQCCAPLRRHFEVMAFCPRHGQVACTFIDVTARKRAEESVRASLMEKEALLKEVHHRVKNNLQIVNSLLHLQSAQIADPRAAELFRSTEDRVRSMALLHETLYRSGNLSRVDLPAYVASLCSHLARSSGVDPGRIQVARRVDPLDLDLDVALPCGMVVTELVANAFKHAFPGGRAGQVTVEMRRLPGDRMAIQVADDGVGMPDGVDPSTVQSLGLQLVRGLASQLGGEARFPGSPGVTCRIEFPGTPPGEAGR